MINYKSAIFQKRLNFYLQLVLAGVSGLAIVCLIMEYGFSVSSKLEDTLHQLDFLAAGIMVGQLFLKLALSPDKRVFFQNNKMDFTAIFIFFLLFLGITGIFKVPKAFPFLKNKGFFSLSYSYLLLSQLYILVFLGLRVPQINKLVVIFKLRPPLVVITTFVLIIGIGTFLLLLPHSTVSGKHTSFLDALFTATSATCVTGLIVVDTGTHFSTLGQLIILLLIQIGGLGLMTFTSFFALVLGRGFGVRDRVLLRDIFSYHDMGKVGSLILSILKVTFVFEALGSILLYLQFLPQAKNGFSAAYSAIFHSISAFCNAGFSLYSDSFIRYQSSLGINLTMSGLIIAGGLGFTVIVNLLKIGYARFKGKREMLSLQSKLVLLVSGVLILLGTSLLYLAERHGVADGLSLKNKILGAYFQAVTARTAGFNTLNIAKLTISSSFLLIMLMFIGASPGSTGGGIKTSTFAVLIFTIKSLVKGKERVEAFKRTIPKMVVYQALCVVILALGWIGISTLLLSFTEKASFLNVLFEDLSAFGTVGLSRGLTPHLSTVGRVIIILTMLVGRTGPLTLALAIGGRKAAELYEYPEERIVIG